MPNENLTEIIVLLDKSGSMSLLTDATIAGFNGFLADQRAAPGAAKLTLVQFGSGYYPMYAGIPVGIVAPLGRDTYVANDPSTAMADSLAKIIGETGQRLAATLECDRPKKVIVVVITDGLDNSSRSFDKAAVKKMVKHQQEVYSWDFLYLGSGQNAVLEGAQYGFGERGVLTCAANVIGTQSLYQSASKSMLRSRSTGEAAAFKAEDRQAQLVAAAGQTS